MEEGEEEKKKKKLRGSLPEVGGKKNFLETKQKI